MNKVCLIKAQDRTILSYLGRKRGIRETFPMEAKIHRAEKARQGLKKKP
jgi:hypothetical protein